MEKLFNLVNVLFKVSTSNFHTMVQSILKSLSNDLTNLIVKIAIFEGPEEIELVYHHKPWTSSGSTKRNSKGLNKWDLFVHFTEKQIFKKSRTCACQWRGASSC